jgi:hypothetical protein
VSASDDLVAEPQREADLRRGWQKRDDAHDRQDMPSRSFA